MMLWRLKVKVAWERYTFRICTYLFASWNKKGSSHIESKFKSNDVASRDFLQLQALQRSENTHSWDLLVLLSQRPWLYIYDHYSSQTLLFKYRPARVSEFLLPLGNEDSRRSIRNRSRCCSGQSCLERCEFLPQHSVSSHLTKNTWQGALKCWGCSSAISASRGLLCSINNSLDHEFGRSIAVRQIPIVWIRNTREALFMNVALLDPHMLKNTAKFIAFHKVLHWHSTLEMARSQALRDPPPPPSSPGKTSHVLEHFTVLNLYENCVSVHHEKEAAPYIKAVCFDAYLFEGLSCTEKFWIPSQQV